MTFTSRFFLAALSLAFVPGCAPTPVGTIETEYTIESIDDVFIEGDVPGRLELVSCRDVYTTKQSVSGQLARDDAGETTEVDTSVPGVHEDGHYWVKLEKSSDGRYLLTEDYEVICNRDSELEFAHQNTIVAEVEFVSGSWEEFQAGQPVQFRYTESGLAAVNEAERTGLLRKLKTAAQLAVAASDQHWRIEATVVEMRLSNPVCTLRKENRSIDGELLEDDADAPLRMECRSDEKVYFRTRVDFFE